jgi:predicted HTH transcriptional regulator
MLVRIYKICYNYSFEAGDKAQLKGKNCTLNEKVILEYLSESPTATQKAIAAVVGKSVRAIKSSMADLQEKDLLKCEGEKKNGKWIVKSADEK